MLTSESRDLARETIRDLRKMLENYSRLSITNQVFILDNSSVVAGEVGPHDITFYFSYAEEDNTTIASYTPIFEHIVLHHTKEDITINHLLDLLHGIEFRKSIVHEVTHFLDHQKSGLSLSKFGIDRKKYESSSEYYEEYYNVPHEVHAYYEAGMYIFEETLKDNPSMRENFLDIPFEDFRKMIVLYFFGDDFLLEMNQNTFRKLTKWIYKYWRMNSFSTRVR